MLRVSLSFCFFHCKSTSATFGVFPIYFYAYFALACILIILFLQLQGGSPRIADFVHGEDGLGNTYQANPKGRKLDISAAEFLIEKAAEFPGEVTVVALGPLTNIALVSSLDFPWASVLKWLLSISV